MGYIADEVEQGVRRANDDGCGVAGCFIAVAVFSLGVGAMEEFLDFLGGPVGAGMVLGTLSVGGWIIYTGK
ncbi:hypothetical protein N9159_00810 [bacterium]|nr:hypothetical protein [bacterium]